MLKRLKLSLLLASLAALASLAVANGASAATAGSFFADPQDTNVPYVAWVGEKVRLVKCVPGAEVGGVGDFAIVDWSGVNPDGHPSIMPSFFPSNAQSRPAFGGTVEQAGRTCYDIVIASEKPGLAKVKLETRGSSANFTHDFLIIWLSMDKPVLDELANDEIPALRVGDPLGDGRFAPIDCDPAPGFQGCFLPGYFRVNVTGSFPLGNNYSDDIDSDPQAETVVLPRDWELLANLYGHSALDADDPSGWDIHDDQTNREGHTALSMCGGIALIDAVDNCLGGGTASDGGNARYSRLVGGTVLFTDGPFDPLRPAKTYLPDGKVDAGDAPMPALRIDVGVSGTFGALATANKAAIYSRNGVGDPVGGVPVNNAHNLYAPFYTAFIPATSAEGQQGNGTSSGVTGNLANNFPGFQRGGFAGSAGLYKYWNLLNTTSRGGFNDCNDVGGTGQVGLPDGVGPIPRPAGINSATVYSDEHGEAIVQFLPDVGVTLEATASQGLCDLGEIGATPRLLATATITAQGELPFEQAQKPIDADPLTKQLFHLAGKSLDCAPKSPIEAFCVETVRDIRGNPVEGAVVAFSREPLGKIEGAELPASGATFIDANGVNTGWNTNGSDCSPRTILLGIPQEILCRTNSLGQAGIVIKSTLPGLVDIDAENFLTRNGGFGVQRVRCLRFAGDGATLPIDAANCAAVSGTTAPGGTSNNNNNNNNNNQNNNQNNAAPSTAAAAAVVVSLAGNPVPAAAAPAAKPAAKAVATKLVSARLVFQGGKRYLVIRANGSAKTAKVRIVLVMRTGKAKAPVVRTIRTNKAVRVANLTVSKHVRTVRVAVVR